MNSYDMTSNVKCVPVIKNLIIFIVKLFKLQKAPLLFLGVSRPDAASLPEVSTQYPGKCSIASLSFGFWGKSQSRRSYA